MAPIPDPNSNQSINSDELIYQAGPQVIQVSSDSDSDDEVDIHAGYVPLAQGPETAQQDDSDSDSDVSTDDNCISKDVPVMPEEKAEQIKAVMANIKLPNIPLWARQVPEQQWMSSLMNNIHKDKQQQSSENSRQQMTSCDYPEQSENLEQSFDADFEAHFAAS